MRPDESGPVTDKPFDKPLDKDDQHIGAVEGDRPSDRPNPVGTAEDRIGANMDESEGG